MWHRIWIVARSEFLRRVRSKWFLIGTVLGPLLLAGFIGGIAFVSVAAMDSGPSRVVVRDESGAGIGARMTASAPDDEPTFVLAPASTSVAELQQSVRDDAYDALLVLPPTVLDSAARAAFYSDGNDLTLRAAVSSRLGDAVRAVRIDAARLAPDVARSLDRTPRLAAERLSATGTEADNALGSYALGFGMGILIYLMMLISGQMVMQGVLEEKQSRVLEVMASSTRPFVLLMGKVLGIGAIGLVQVMVWAALASVLSTAGGGIAALLTGGGAPMPGGAPPQGLPEGFALPTIGPLVPVVFVLFFLGGYLLYASLFAAIGSAVEQQQEAQSLLLPLMLPIVGAFAAMQGVLASPDSPTSVALSLVPFLSPVLMVARVAVTDVPLWQIAASFALLVGAFLGAIWVSARIYRVGILSYGKKPSLADLWRWLRQPA